MKEKYFNWAFVALVATLSYVATADPDIISPLEYRDPVTTFLLSPIAPLHHVSLEHALWNIAYLVLLLPFCDGSFSAALLYLSTRYVSVSMLAPSMLHKGTVVYGVSDFVFSLAGAILSASLMKVKGKNSVRDVVAGVSGATYVSFFFLPLIYRNLSEMTYLLSIGVFSIGHVVSFVVGLMFPMLSGGRRGEAVFTLLSGLSCLFFLSLLPLIPF